MNTDRELMQQALEALSDYIPMYDKRMSTITALRERLAQPEPDPEQEPVGYFKLSGFNVWWQVSRADSDIQGVVPLYTSPPASKPLTDEQIDELRSGYQSGRIGSFVALARAIEAAHGIKGEA